MLQTSGQGDELTRMYLTCWCSVLPPMGGSTEVATKILQVQPMHEHQGERRKRTRVCVAWWCCTTSQMILTSKCSEQQRIKRAHAHTHTHACMPGLFSAMNGALY
eukprot:1151812-Pelagomonas_calceolata.AAC.3